MKNRIFTPLVSACFAGLFSLSPGGLFAQTVPSITAITPSAASIGSSVTIDGADFSTTISDNVVWFGGVKATITAATATSLTVTVPAGAGPVVRVYTSGLSTQSLVRFVYTFPGTEPLAGANFGSVTSSQSYVVKNGSYTGLDLHSLANLKFADLDGDAKPDLICGRMGTYVQHNTSTPGTISRGTLNGSTVEGASFEAGFGGGGVQGYLSELTTYGTNAAREGEIDYGDVDGDGKIDIVSSVYRPSNTDRISVFRNITSTPGSLNASNFDAPVVYGTSGRWARMVRLGDLDNDGKIDILVSTSGGGGMIFRNTSTPGTPSFAAAVEPGLGLGEGFIEISDMDGDGKNDIVTRGWGGDVVRVLRNTSSGPGVFSFSAAQSFAVESGVSSFDIGDLDGDGKTDVLAFGSSGKLFILRNTSTSGTVAFATYYTITTHTGNVQDAAMGDLDGDGKIDIALNDGGYIMYVIKNTSTPGSLSFDPYEALNPSGGMSQYASEIAIQDIDGDGKNDVVGLSTYSNGIHFFSNETSSTLPVNWLGFTAHSRNNGVQLNWTTASEKDNAYFEVERSTQQARGFQPVGRITGALNSNGQQRYDWFDATAPETTLWYRIKQVDADGGSTYSTIVRVNRLPGIQLELSPNPVSNQLRITIPVAGNSTMDLRIHDTQGRILLQKKISTGTSFIDCKTWVPGIYSITVYDGTQMVTTKRFMKQ
ncbi:FG-GAP-like repeat-containing protein [Parasegetibacter sp. NRK P23]|uniref:FG-GAP-like repeat-containing protein n=1 Tax=Parasegetibacter sp. NRK P23 TaxID=2942999 RepID=UPI0020431C35|nr:FG-GAP-like repeat-containing protein [Parasegetibacter sp. NRK P23]MCM5527352.1 FG-GAP-like repeat-containing protein [Parasegetibacter sp. NRK P23]